jgi:hypothetical protein
MRRLHQAVLIGSTLGLCWLAMMGVHELGHVIGALLTGGEVARVVLHPLTISRTDLAHNPHPLVVTWAGPVLGVLLPVVAWLPAQHFRVSGWYLLRFFAGFCLIANGAYLGVGSFDRVGDAGDLLRHGAPVWQLWAFGLLTVPPGFFLWHRLGPHFGLGDAHGKVSVRAAYLCLGALLVFVAVASTFGGE